MEIKARRGLVDSNPISSFFIGIAGLLLLIGLNHWLFAQFFKPPAPTYLQWYFNNAAAIGIGSALFSTIWGQLDEHPEVISAHPVRFVAAYMGLLGMYFFAFNTNLKGGSSEAPDFDSVVGLLLSAILMVVILVGLLVIGPLQYFVFLLCGSPARLLLRSDLRLISLETNNHTELRQIRNGEEVPAGWQDISLRKKPFTLTNVITLLLAGVLKLFEFDTVF